MQLILWEGDSVGVAHHILDGFDVRGEQYGALIIHQPHHLQPWRRYGWFSYISLYAPPILCLELLLRTRRL